MKMYNSKSSSNYVVQFGFIQKIENVSTKNCFWNINSNNLVLQKYSSFDLFLIIFKLKNPLNLLKLLKLNNRKIKNLNSRYQSYNYIKHQYILLFSLNTHTFLLHLTFQYINKGFMWHTNIGKLTHFLFALSLLF